MFLLILNQISLAAKSAVNRGSLLFKRLLITNYISSKLELKARAFLSLALLGRKIRQEAANSLAERWEAEKRTFSCGPKEGLLLIQVSLFQADYGCM